MTTIDCPQCGTENSDGNHLCTNCGYPLSWADEASRDPVKEQPDMSVEPGPDPAPDHEWAGPGSVEHDEPSAPADTLIEPPVAPPADPVAPGINCAVCGTRNPLERTYCMRCGALLVEAPTVPTPTVRKRPRIPWYMIAAGVGVVALIAGLLVARPWDDASPTTTAIGEGGGDNSDTSATTAPSTSAPPMAVLVDRTRVSASASSSGTTSGSVTYGPSNMLDGDLSTAWNHCNEGEDEAQPCFGTGGVDEELTFTFSESIELARIDLANGYQRTAQNGDDRFTQNARIKDMTISTVNGDFQFSLPDGRAVHAFEAAFGLVTRVIIHVDSVYPGAEWQDLAVSEVSFYEREAPTGSSTEAPGRSPAFTFANATTSDDGPLYSGCAPGTSDTLPDGWWLGYVESWTEASVDFDLVCVVIVQDGQGRDVAEVTNNSSNLRQVVVDSAAFGYTWTGYPGTPRSVADTLDEIDRNPVNGAPPPHLVFLAVNGGQITELVEWISS